MLKRNARFYVLMAVAAAVVSSAGGYAFAAEQTVVSFRLGKWKEAHFKDAASAKRHFDTVRQLGCEAKQDSHAGHYDVLFRAPRWRSIKLKSDQEAHQWAHWLDGNGFETVFVQPASGGHLETVAYRLAGTKSGHFDSKAEADSQADTLRMLGCQVKQGSHGGHYDVSYSCTQWRVIGVESHDQAHRWEKWLKANGFETRHDHSTARNTGGANRRR